MKITLEKVLEKIEELDKTLVLENDCLLTEEEIDLFYESKEKKMKPWLEALLKFKGTEIGSRVNVDL